MIPYWNWIAGQQDSWPANVLVTDGVYSLETFFGAVLEGAVYASHYNSIELLLLAVMALDEMMPGKDTLRYTTNITKIIVNLPPVLRIHSWHLKLTRAMYRSKFWDPSGIKQS